MVDNINTNSMVGKVIAVLIALLFVTVLAFPIANSLGNIGKGGDESEPQKTVINSWDNSVGLTSTKYKSYDVYIPSETPTLPHEISCTLEDINDIAETFTPVGDVENVNLTLIDVYSYNQEVGVYFEGSKLRFDVPDRGVDENDVESFTVTISTDYTVSYSLKTSDSDDVLTGQFTAESVLVLSESEYGWDYFNLNKGIAVGSKLILSATIPLESESSTYKQIELTQDMFSDNQLQFTVDWGEGYHSDVTFSITPDAIPGVSKVGGYNMVSVDGDGNTVHVNAEIDYLTITYESSDSDSGSGSGSGSDGLGNVASTLVKLVPILLIVGILLIFVMPMINGKAQ